MTAFEPPTILAIDGLDLGDYSCRGLTQTLEPIEQSKQMHRTVNGELIDLSATQFRKYKSTISCNDQEAPDLTDIWPGKEITVLTVTHLTGPNPVYLYMRVMSYQISRDEWGAQTNWSIDLEEQ